MTTQNNSKNVNSVLFKQAHKLTKQTIQPNETYRYKFGQWLIFLKTGVTNVLGITNINQSVCYVPIMPHDNKSIYYTSLPLTFNKRTGNYVQSLHMGNMMYNMLKSICTSKYTLFIILSFIIYRII